jgi:hypothetical protein
VSEYLERKCENLGIRLVYTYNKSTVLSAEINKGKPLLIADMLFKNCPDSISQAIIDFFTDIKHKSSHERIIKNFVEDYFNPYAPGKIKHMDLSYLVKQIQSGDNNHKTKLEDTKHNTNPEDDDFENDLKDTNYTVKHKDDDYKINFDMASIDTSKIDVNDPNLVEFGIYHINAKDFWGGEKQYRPNTSIRPIKDEELQLNIVVLPPGT